MIIVTGASSGMGLAIAKRLVAEGREVTGISRSRQELDFPTYSCDVTSHEELQRVSRLLSAAGHQITGLINAAGVASMNLALMTPRDTTRRVIETNLLGTIYSCQVFAPQIIRAGGGAIVNFSSIAVALGLEGEAVYAASKAGVEVFSRVLAKELSSHMIRVNCIAPGPIETRLLRGVSEEQKNKIVNQQVFKKIFTAEEVSELTVSLLGQGFRSVSGQTIRVGGV